MAQPLELRSVSVSLGYQEVEKAIYTVLLCTCRRPRPGPPSQSAHGACGPQGPPAPSGRSGCYCSCLETQERRVDPALRF